MVSGSLCPTSFFDVSYLVCFAVTGNDGYMGVKGGSSEEFAELGGAL